MRSTSTNTSTPRQQPSEQLARQQNGEEFHKDDEELWGGEFHVGTPALRTKRSTAVAVERMGEDFVQLDLLQSQQHQRPDAILVRQQSLGVYADNPSRTLYPLTQVRMPAFDQPELVKLVQLLEGQQVTPEIRFSALVAETTP
jgi:hypothetical protein